MGFDEKAISEKRVHIKSSNGYIMDYTDGEQIKQVKYDDLQFYEMIVQTECVAIKMECLWNSEDVPIPSKGKKKAPSRKRCRKRVEKSRKVLKSKIEKTLYRVLF